MSLLPFGINFIKKSEVWQVCHPGQIIFGRGVLERRLASAMGGLRLQRNSSLYGAVILCLLLHLETFQAAPALEPPPSSLGPAVVGPSVEKPFLASESLPAKPQEQFPSIYPLQSFGPDSVPWEVFNSAGYMVPLGKMSRDYEWRNGSGPSICRTGTFDAVSPDKFDRYPSSNVGRLYVQLASYYWSWCSATQISADVIITAAHCVYDCQSQTWIRGGTYYDGRYDQSYRNFSPLKSFTAWTECDSDNIPVYDFALIRLGTPIHKEYYPATYAPSTSALGSSHTAYVYSYPANSKPGNIPYLSWQEHLGATYPIASRAELALSIEAGSSGSALFVNNLPSNFPAENLVVGITSYEYSRGDCPNGFAVFLGPEGGYNPQTLLRSLSP